LHFRAARVVGAARVGLHDFGLVQSGHFNSCECFNLRWGLELRPDVRLAGCKAFEL
jgi:hypothetical protein